MVEHEAAGSLELELLVVVVVVVERDDRAVGTVRVVRVVEREVDGRQQLDGEQPQQGAQQARTGAATQAKAPPHGCPIYE